MCGGGYLDDKRYLVILRQDFFNPNSDETLLAEDQTNCYGVKVYLRPRVFGGRQLIDARYQVESQFKLGISWDVSTRYLYISPPTRKDINRLGYLQLTCGEPYSTYIHFVRSNRQFRLDEPCLVTGRLKTTWTNEKIQEWRQRLGYVSAYLVKKTFEAHTQDYPGVRHGREVTPKKYSVVVFTRLPDPMRGIIFNKETFSVDFLEDTHAGEKFWGLVFYSVNYKLLDYYRLGSKDTPSSSTLYALVKSISEHGIPSILTMDCDSILGTGKKRKQVLGRTFTPLHLYEPDKHNKNPVECAIQNLKAGCSKIRNACGTRVLAYH